MDGLRAGIRDQRLQVAGDTLGPTEVHCTRQLVSLWPVILKGEDAVQLTHYIASNYSTVVVCKSEVTFFSV